MTQSTLVKIINQLETLEPKELEQLSQAIQTRLNVTDSSKKMTKFYESLLSSGFIRQVKSPLLGQIRQPLIEVKGKPISETIIEERR
jgi:hypothetical protein